MEYFFLAQMRNITRRRRIGSNVKMDPRNSAKPSSMMTSVIALMALTSLVSHLSFAFYFFFFYSHSFNYFDQILFVCCTIFEDGLPYYCEPKTIRNRCIWRFHDSLFDVLAMLSAEASLLCVRSKDSIQPYFG